MFDSTPSGCLPFFIISENRRSLHAIISSGEIVDLIFPDHVIAYIPYLQEIGCNACLHTPPTAYCVPNIGPLQATERYTTFANYIAQTRSVKFLECRGTQVSCGVAVWVQLPFVALMLCRLLLHNLPKVRCTTLHIGMLSSFVFFFAT